MTKETAILVPKVVFTKAKELHKYGLHEQALQILEENKVEFDIYSNQGNHKQITAKIPDRIFKGNDPVEMRAKQLRGKRNANL